MDIDYFNNFIKPKLLGCDFEYKNFLDGQFGDLSRVEIEGRGKVGTLDIWSTGWVGMDVFDLEVQDQIMNSLCSPEDEACLTASILVLIELFDKH